MPALWPSRQPSAEQGLPAAFGCSVTVIAGLRQQVGYIGGQGGSIPAFQAECQIHLRGRGLPLNGRGRPHRGRWGRPNQATNTMNPVKPRAVRPKCTRLWRPLRTMLRMASFTKLAGAAVPAAGELAAAMPLGAWEGGEGMGLGGLVRKCGIAEGATRARRSEGRVSGAGCPGGTSPCLV